MFGVGMNYCDAVLAEPVRGRSTNGATPSLGPVGGLEADEVETGRPRRRGACARRRPF